MSLTYAEFNDLLYEENSDFTGWISTIQVLEGIHPLDIYKLVYFYAKNLFNDSPTELIFFLESGLLIVTQNQKDSTIHFEKYNCKIASKSLTIKKHIYGNHELKIVFDNGKELLLDNVIDSNRDWNGQYATSLRELYKVI